MKNYLNIIISFLTQLLFGVRIEGEKISQPKFKTTLPPNQPSEFDWKWEFRVSSLHNVNQRVYL